MKTVEAKLSWPPKQCNEKNKSQFFVLSLFGAFAQRRRTCNEKSEVICLFSSPCSSMERKNYRSDIFLQQKGRNYLKERRTKAKDKWCVFFRVVSFLPPLFSWKSWYCPLLWMARGSNYSKCGQPPPTFLSWATLSLLVLIGKIGTKGISLTQDWKAQ